LVTLFAAGILWTVSLVALFCAALSDFKRRIIPNRLVAIIPGCGVAIRLLWDPRSIGFTVAVAGAVLLLLGFLARRELIGGGDVKLIAAVTFLVSPGQIITLFFGIAVLGGLLSCIYLLVHLALRRREMSYVAGNRGRCPPSRWGGYLGPEVVRIAAQESVPYGLAVAGSTASIALTEAIRWFFATS
jgi:prepilin peptidase CpaA